MKSLIDYDIEELVGNAIFNEPSGELVFVRDIEFYSLCEHHLLPFFGKAHVMPLQGACKFKNVSLMRLPQRCNVSLVQKE